MGMEPPAGHCPQARGSSGAAWNGDGMEFYTAAEKWAMKLAWLSYTKKAPEVGVPERLKNYGMDRISIKSSSGIKCA